MKRNTKQTQEQTQKLQRILNTIDYYEERFVDVNLNNFCELHLLHILEN